VPPLSESCEGLLPGNRKREEMYLYVCRGVVYWGGSNMGKAQAPKPPLERG